MKKVNTAGMGDIMFGIIGGFGAQFIVNKTGTIIPDGIKPFVGAGAGLLLVLAGATKKPMMKNIAIGMAGHTGAQLPQMLGISAPEVDFDDSELGLNEADTDNVVFLNPNRTFEEINAAADFSASVSSPADFAASVSGSNYNEQNQLF